MGIAKLKEAPSGMFVCFALSVGMALGIGCKKEEQQTAEVAEPGCHKDDSRGTDTAVDLSMSKSITGYICPKQDIDWYAFRLESGNRLLSVSAKMSADISPVELTYAIFSKAEPDKAVAVSPEEESEGVHCLDPGDYYLVLRDQGNDNEDIRHSYSLEIDAQPEPDAAEPNDGTESATELASGVSHQGYIACAGDQDWYVIDVAQGNVLGVHVSSPVAAYQPKVRLLATDGNILAERVNAASAVEATSIDIFQVLQRSGKYTVAVSDDDDKEADPKVPYAITVEAIEDKDTHEPNNSPSEATPLAASSQTCGSSWSTTFEIKGTVGARGDVDWYKLPVTACQGGVIEADLQFDTQGLSNSDAWQFQSKVQASLALVRAHPGTPCKKDTECQSLKITCDPKKQGWECQGFFNSCLSDGFCAGAAACLPSGVCGANQTERHYRVAAVPSAITGPPPENKVSLSAPLFGDDLVYLRVTDYQSDGGDPSALYTLKVRIRSDPDPNDRAATPNNLYGNLLNNDNFPVEESFSRATPLAVHNCTKNDCCGSPATWITGAISYQNDVDWYKYEHPCPCKDCLLTLYYQVDDGPVEHGFYLFQGESQFYTFKIAGEDIFGDDECLYSYQGHCGNCSADSAAARCGTYYIAIRDYLGEGKLSQDVIGTAGRWSSDQLYRICLEKVSDECRSPCEVAKDGTCKSP